MMPDNRHLLSVVGLFLLVTAIGGMLLMLPTHRQTKSMREEIVSLNAKVSDMAALESLVDTLETRRDQAEETIHRDLKIIPESANVAELMRRLSLRVDQQTVHDQTFTAGSSSKALPGDSETVRLMPLTVEMESAFDATFAVIQAAESMDRLVRVNSVRMSCDRDKQARKGVPYVLASIGLEAIYDPGEHVEE